MSAKKSSAPAANTAVATVSNTLPAAFDPAMMMADAGLGRESMSVTDMALPYFSLLQSLSPQVKKSSPDRILDAEEGDIFNTVTKELFGEEGITVIPCAFQKAWVEWAPRDSGGGFIASHGDDTIMQICNRNEAGFDVRSDNGNLIVATFYYYVLRLKDDGSWEYGIIAMSRTAMKKARKWNSLLSSLMIPGPQGSFNPPMFAQRYSVKGVAESNAKGDFYNWDISYLGLVETPEIYAVAKKFAEQVRAGAVKVAPPSHEAADDDDGAHSVF